jgi:mannose-1-phosphate guanylyltransferase/mannose-6-phosphate isomerase
MYAVILAGGGGTRLWPLSRRDRPKPFLPLLGQDSLFQRTLGRLEPLIDAADVYVVTEARHAPLAREQAPWLHREQLIVEPMGRNTAAAIALAALAIERPADEVMVVLPADHAISDEAAFRSALAVAAEAATDGSLVTLGITPGGPEPAYGYVVADAGSTASRAGVRRVSRFVEKPGRERAAALLAEGAAWWNAGIFVWRRDALLDRLERHASAVLGPLRDALAAGADIGPAYADLPAISIDYAVLEPASLEGAVKVVPAAFDWSDVGSWPALRAQLAAAQPPGSRGVVEIGRSIDLDSEDVLVHSSGSRLVVTIGLRGTIVVDTPDVVLVCDADRAQDVRQIVSSLAEAKETEHL